MRDARSVCEMRPTLNAPNVGMVDYYYTTVVAYYCDSS